MGRRPFFYMRSVRNLWFRANHELGIELQPKETQDVSTPIDIEVFVDLAPSPAGGLMFSTESPDFDRLFEIAIVSSIPKLAELTKEMDPLVTIGEVARVDWEHLS